MSSASLITARPRPKGGWAETPFGNTKQDKNVSLDMQLKMSFQPGLCGCWGVLPALNVSSSTPGSDISLWMFLSQIDVFLRK